ncbi:hypothetical protein PVAND_016714 [Polypedilum vanderplanki]|uniref:Uncharacterized protein n=1 Tax=Polypedilum vanderplanki TaxID=319348 RepID=A0A9J6BFY6_POLVA|nr:hypothetical protein PVAND_016714 [Polypedilum vanderplanki]
MLSRISDSTIKIIQCSSQLTTTELNRKTFEVLKITKCPSVSTIFDYITSASFREHFIEARCAFVIVAECNSDVTVRKLRDDELKTLSQCYKDKKLMVISIEGGKDEIEVDSKDIRNLGSNKLQKKFSFEDIEDFYGENWREDIGKALAKIEKKSESIDEEENCKKSTERKVSTQIYYKQLHECDFITIGNKQINRAINSKVNDKKLIKSQQNSEDFEENLAEYEEVSNENEEKSSENSSTSNPTSIFTQTFNFSSLLLNLTAHNYGTFNGRLLETQIDTLTCYNKKRLIDFAIENNKILSIRFLQLFNFNLHLANGNDDRPLEIAARLPTMDAFIALLKFKFEFWNDELNKCDYNLLHLRNKRSFTLLMLAAASGNSGIVNLLAKFGVDKNYEAHGETAASLAWKNQKFEAFLMLIKFDARYPRNFKCELEERWENVPKELKKFVTTVEAFHLAVSKKEKEEYEKILQNYPNIFHFYNTRNESAALIALKNGNCNSWTYEELIKLGIFIGFDEKFDEIIKINDENPKVLSGRNLITLMSKSHVGYSTSYDEKKKKIHYVLKTFKTLYGIDQIRPILKIVVERPIKIIFDFSRQSVQHLHPEVHNYSSASTFTTKGYIYIGAKGLYNPKEECDVLATLSHKLLHYVLQVIYENESRPYFADDVDRAAEFAEVNAFCKEQIHHEKIIEKVYEFDPNEQHAELIARVAHVLALYCNNEEKKKNCIEKFKKLFGFYNSRVLSDLKPQNLIEMKLKNEIYKLNTCLGTVTELRASKYKLKTEALKVNVTLKEKSVIFLSNCPQLTVTAIFQRYKIESYYIGSAASLHSLHSQKSDNYDHQQRLFLYASHEKVDETHILGRVKEFLKVFDTFDSHLSLTLIVNCDGRSMKVLKNIAKKFQPYRIVLIINVNANTINREVLGRNFELRDIKHTWNDLTPIAQNILMDFNVNFQGYEMKLKNFLVEGSASWKEVPLNILLTKGSLKIGEKIENDTKYYVRRMFIDSTARSNRWDQERNEFVDEYDKPIKSFDEITGTEATKVILLADEPKAGKTSTFKSIATRLKEKFIGKWIVFIDHKHHADVYRTCKSIEWNQHKLAQFISQDVLQLQEFEQKIFEEFFVDGRVIVLLEMNVFYQEILDFAVRIKELSKNQLWISSWPQHANKLEAAFKTTAFKLVLFNDENRREFFVKFLNSKGITDELEIEERLKEIEDFLQLRHKEDGFPFDIPLMLRMVAEVYENSLNSPTQKFSSNNLFSLYQAFTTRTLGSLASNSRLNIMQLHQKYALKEVFCRKKKNDCEEIVKSLQILAPRCGNNHKKIFTCGIMYKLERAKLKFIHKTFADFFVAQYIIDNVLNANMSGNNTEAELRSLLFLNIIRDSNRCHKTIHRFLDNYIEMNEAELEERFDESCYTFLSNFKPPNYFRGLLWRLARHRCFFLIKFLTELYSDDEKILREMWGVVSLDGYSFLFKTIDKEDGEIDFTFTERVWSLAREVFHDRKDLIAILKTTLIRSSCSVFKNVFPNFWIFADEFLTQSEKIEILTKDALQLFVRNKTKKFFSDVCEIAEANLTHNEMKLFLTNHDADGKNFLYHFSKSMDDEALLEFLEKVKKYLTIEEQKSLLTKRLKAMLEEDKKTPPRSFHALWSFAEQQLDKDELKSLLLTTNSSGFTIFHETIIEGDEKTFNFMVEVHERILEKEEIKELIMRKFQSNKTLLFKSMGVSIESILMLWDYLQDLLDDDEETLKKFLAHRDDFGDTAFSSMKWYDAFPNDLFMPFIKENFSKTEIEKIFEKISITSVENSAIELRLDEHDDDFRGSNRSRKQKFLFLNCFCCKEAV